MNNPKHEVAISFLSQDISLALDFESRLSPSMSVFVYPKNQKEIAATDGLVTFREIFLNQSRSVVVLFRNGWGNNSWTRVEEAAIKERFLRDGWEWLVFVMLDSKSKPPAWLPPFEMRVNFEEYGIEQSVGVIKACVQKLGGIVHQETIEENIIRLKQEKAFQEYRQEFLESHKSIGVAKKEAEDLFVQFETIATSISDPAINYPIKTKREYDNTISLESTGFTIVIALSYDVLNDSRKSLLYIRMYEKDRKDRFADNRKQNLKDEKTYALDITPPEHICWREQFGEKRFLDSKLLAEQQMRSFIENIRTYLLRDK